MVGELKYYAQLAAEQAAAVAATGASSSVAGPSTVVHDISSDTEMENDLWESLIRECDEEESEDGEFWD
jgi:hypothetical protein